MKNISYLFRFTTNCRSSAELCTFCLNVCPQYIDIKKGRIIETLPFRVSLCWPISAIQKLPLYLCSLESFLEILPQEFRVSRHKMPLFHTLPCYAKKNSTPSISDLASQAAIIKMPKRIQILMDFFVAMFASSFLFYDR